MNTLNRIKREASKHHVSVIARGENGLVQLRGPHLLVNYWPDSKRRTAYVDGTRDGFHNVSVEQAIRMALQPPPIQPNMGGRKNSANIHRQRLRLWKKDPRCHWCRTMLALHETTLDHVIPLHRGGLDNHNNTVLACEPCNRSRGHDMPELQERTHG